MKSLALLAFAALLIGAASAEDISACGTLSTLNGNYTLIADLTNTTDHCITLGANGITIDGAGHTITGAQVANKYMINGNSRTGLTVKNVTCHSWSSCTSGTSPRNATNLTAINISGGAFRGVGNFSDIIAINISNNLFNPSSSTFSFTNFTQISNSGTNIYCQGCSNGIISNGYLNISTAGSEIVAFFTNSNKVNFTNLIFNSSINARNVPFFGADTATNMIYENITLYSNTTSAGTSDAAFIFTNSDNSTVTNLTYVSQFTGRPTTTENGKATILFMNGSRAGYVVCLSNFTYSNNSGHYAINNSVGAGLDLNCSVDGKQQGNIYPDVLNGSVNITGTVLSSLPGLYIGNAGTGYPYNTTNGGAFVIGATDYYPLTPTYGGAYPIPEITANTVLPASPSATDTLQCQITATTDEQTSFPITYIEWYKNGTNQTSLAATYANLENNTATNISSVGAGNLSNGQNWSCRVNAFNGVNYTGWNMSANVTIGGGAIDSCTYSGSGNWNILMKDMCNITSSVNVGNNFIILNASAGHGAVSINGTSPITISAKRLTWDNFIIPGLDWIVVRTMTWLNFTG